ncbi:hypothetical protein CAPN006_09830 [Capnocytophaga canimorsus]|uniref:hypothetical protein n=1 Tax=Capnocytophaga TaxID=1016 RepID=UPI001ACA3B7E|nr:hypothetical protein [Capnocytophaga canimorsus]GIM56589.1 hypothetical protein CAPN006_09830 [Capnocytophaga canimorsus]
MDFYKYQKPLGKIDDIAELRNEFIVIFDLKTHQDMVVFCLELGNHLLELTQIQPCDEILSAFEAMKEWLEKKNELS